MVIRNSFILAILMVANNCFGYFYCVYAAKKRINNNTAPQYIILLADYHDKTHPINKEQRAYLESLLQRCRNKKVKLIVEDLSSTNNDGRMICCKYGINCADGVLGHLAHKARSCGIPVDNVEYRYCRVASIGPLINNLHADPHSFKSSATITLLSLYKEIINEIEKIKRYDDGKTLNTFYKQVIADVHNMLSKMKLCCIDRKISVAHHCTTLKHRTYRQELEKLCIFDSALIDINIMHAIVCCDANLIFVVAGGSHIEQVYKWLKKMGYEAFFVVPHHRFKPVDITVLDTFLKYG